MSSFTARECDDKWKNERGEVPLSGMHGNDVGGTIGADMDALTGNDVDAIVKDGVDI
ncbi:unnamed protein product [Sphenostylis stenocarpa]|uniref:Uncharacterized protein n=1 Tax=Sphenostylis stenocarpa TaxID=92480 RepID=A0AA86S998_9FABA|nr:unnamed protein product [Sphenostylis stenocarpa]